MEKPHLTVSAAIIFNDARDQVLITRRNPGGPHGGLWEFPGGKVEPSETPVQGLLREIREELDIILYDVEPYLTVEYAYSAFLLTLHTFTACIARGAPQPLACAELKWAQLEDLSALPFPEADARVIRRLQDDFVPGVVVLPVSDILDLHTFRPRDVKPLLLDYLERCHRAGIGQVRIIHGKGTGTLKRIVRGILERSPFVMEFYDAPETAGGWGATIARLAPMEDR